MKFRSTLLFAFLLILSACNYTLAEDITPPPNYVPPSPPPTLGPLYPAQAPNIENGAAIFAAKCAPCHGEEGLGDGEQGIQLGVTVPAIGLSEIALPATLAQWYTVVTQGNIERFMPPFASLSDQERWDVVAYAMTLHTSGSEIAKGRELFEANCANCPAAYFKDPVQMAVLSEVELARIVRQGNQEVPAFGADLSEEEVWAVAAYLQTLMFDTAPVASAPTPASAVLARTAPAPYTVTPAVELTNQSPLAGGPTSAVAARIGTITGSVENRSGAALPAVMTVTLRGYDHGADPSTGPQEVLTRDGLLNADGTFMFEDVEIPQSRIFIAEVDLDGTKLQSGFAIVREGDTSVSLPPVILYPKTNDTSALVMDEVRIFFEYGSDSIQVYNVYSFRNPGDKIIMVSLPGNNEIPFLKSPDGSSGFGYEPMQGSEKFLQTENGFAIPPSEGTYGLIAFSTLPKTRKLDFSQPYVLPVAAVTVFLPEGVSAEGAQLTDQGIQAIQNFNFQIYEVDRVRAGDRIAFTLLGTPEEAATASLPDASPNRNLLIGAGALGIALILAGVWMRLRGRAEDVVGPEDGIDEFGSAEDVMDAIIALDDLHRASKISTETHQKRRAELKDILKEML